MKRKPNPWVRLTRLWWIGIGISCVLWVLPIYLVMVGAPSRVTGIAILYGWFIAWILMPVSIYDDIKHVRRLSNWEPNRRLYVAVSIIPFIATGAGTLYLYNRHKYLGTP